jgi:hypothetical protein
LFSDAEELGLNGAALLQPSTIGQKKWDLLNFEARGTSGPSYMLMETNVEMGDLLKNLLQQTLLFQYQTH